MLTLDDYLLSWNGDDGKVGGGSGSGGSVGGGRVGDGGGGIGSGRVGCDSSGVAIVVAVEESVTDPVEVAGGCNCCLL